MKGASDVGTDFRPELAATNVEFRVHLAVFAGVIFPVAGVILPSVLLALAAYLVLHLLPGAGTVAEAYWPLLWFACAGILIAIGITASLRACTPSASRAARRLRPVSGKPGEDLTRIVSGLWMAAGQHGRKQPEILCFANFNAMANAVVSGNRSELHVSSALWDRALRNDEVARGILAHEIAHLAFRDPLRFRLLESASEALRAITRALEGAVLAAAIVLTSAILLEDLATEKPSAAVGHLAASVLITSLAYWAAAALGFAGRRYAALIIALMELRADIEGGRLSGGIRAFGAALAQDPSVCATSIAELRHSWLSPSLTHFSVKERTSFLTNPQRLLTPKLRYFLFSLLLVLLLPLNPVTPLLLGGALDHLLAAAANFALQTATIAMIIVGSDDNQPGLGLPRALQLAAMLIVAGVIPHVNMHVVGYLLLSVGTQFATPGGIGGTDLSTSSLRDDVLTTMRDMSAKIWAGADGLLGLLAVAVTAGALWCLSRLARLGDRPATPWVAVLPTCLAGVLAILTSYDEWRGQIYELDPFASAHIWKQQTYSGMWLRLSAPAIGALLVLALQTIIRHSKGRSWFKARKV